MGAENVAPHLDSFPGLFSPQRLRHSVYRMRHPVYRLRHLYIDYAILYIDYAIPTCPWLLINIYEGIHKVPEK